MVIISSAVLFFFFISIFYRETDFREYVRKFSLTTNYIFQYSSLIKAVI